MTGKQRPWYPVRRYLVLWGLERVLWSDWAGTGYKWLRYDNGCSRLFWTRAQAQAHADKLNREPHGNTPARPVR